MTFSTLSRSGTGTHEHAAWQATKLPAASASNDRSASVVDGLVVHRGKYSFTVRAADGDRLVHLPESTPIFIRLTRPEIDMDSQTVRMAIVCSAPDGVAENNEVVEYRLPEPVFVHAWFEHENQMQRVLQNPVKQLVNFDLTSQPSIDSATDSADLRFVAQLKSAAGDDLYQLAHGDQTITARLGSRNARLAGRSILDLEPFATEAVVKVVEESGQTIATEVEIVPVGDPLNREDSSLPRMLHIGDTVSLNYQRALREVLGGTVNIHHPPLNCGGSENWQQMHRWLGAYDQPGRHWDVIAINFGLWDDRTSKSAYQANVRRALKLAQQTGAKIIWVTSTPIDYGFNSSGEADVIAVSQRAALRREAANPEGRVPGRMRVVNDWAREVLLEFPDILVSDLYKVVKDAEHTIYSDWWYNRDISFEYRESIPLARTLARSVYDAMGRKNDALPSMSVHGVNLPQWQGP